MVQDYITVSEAMKLADVHRCTIISWCRKFGLGVKIGGRWRVNKEDLLCFLNGTEVKGV